MPRRQYIPNASQFPFRKVNSYNFMLFFMSFNIVLCHFIFQGDPFYPPINITTGRPFCLAFTRSMPGQLTLGFREQMNQITSFADASNVYGSDLCEMVSTLHRVLEGQLTFPKNTRTLIHAFFDDEAFCPMWESTFYVKSFDFESISP